MSDAVAVIDLKPMTKRQSAGWLIGIAVVLAGICLTGNVGIVFALLIALMLTGVPVSIALGLTVLMFMFFMTSQSGESMTFRECV